MQAKIDDDTVPIDSMQHDIEGNYIGPSMALMGHGTMGIGENIKSPPYKRRVSNEIRTVQNEPYRR